MMTRLTWMSVGYVAGAASSWWVQRKARRTVEKVLPQAVRNEVANRVGEAGHRVGDATKGAVERTKHSAVGRGAQRAYHRVRPEGDVDLTDADRDPAAVR